MEEIKKECKVIDIFEWRKKNEEKVKLEILKQILERGNPLDKK